MDESNFECRLWPRALSVAERLWSAKDKNFERKKYNDDVERRMKRQHQRMVERGLLSSSLHGASKDYCGHVEQSIQRDVHRLSKALLVPHLYLGAHEHLFFVDCLAWSRNSFSQSAVGYVFVLRSALTHASQTKRTKQLQRMAKSVGMPHLNKCVLRNGYIVLLLGLFGKPVVDCDQFQRSGRESGMHRVNKYFVGVDFVTKSSSGEKSVSSMSSLRVRLDAENGMRASWRAVGDQRGKSGL
jgi:hypothetical protein